MEENQTTISFELLADYVDGLVDRATAQRIEKRLAEDEYSRAIVEGIRTFYEQKGHDRENLEAYLKDFQQRLEAQYTYKTRGWRSFPLFQMAAAVLMLLGAVFVFRLFIEDGSSDLLSQELAEPYPSVYILQKGTGPDALAIDLDSIRSQARLLYEQRAFDQLIPLLEALTAKPAAEAQDHFTLGLAYLYSSPAAPEKAIEALQKAKAIDSAILQQQIDWFLALSYLKAGQEGNAGPLLRQMAANENHFKRLEAEQLLNQNFD